MRQCIMVVDHNENNLLSLQKLLVASDYEVIIASQQDGLTENLRRDDIHLTLVNTSTAFIDISWFCSYVRERKEHHHMPVFFISNTQEDVDEATRCFAAGGNDYLKKPINTKELLSRIDFHIRQCVRIAEADRRNEKLANVATFDQLTKVSSRLHMQTQLRQHIVQLDRQSTDVSLIYLRIMKFSRVNNLMGYTQGDKALYLFAQTLKGMLRKSDVIGRWGGIDFVVILPYADDKSALTLAKKVNKSLIINKGLEKYSLKYSLGVAQLRKDETVASLIDRSRSIMEEASQNTHENILVD